MQGYILNTQKVRDEDLLVTILTENRIKILYRFYGARHSNLLLGYKIDFEAHPTNRENLKQLRNVSLLNFKWLLKRERYYIWQQFLQLLFKHLRDVNEVDSFYYKLLEETSLYLEKSHPKRVVIESYAKLLEFEGRLHNDFSCFICEKNIESKVVLTRAFLPACSTCLKSENGFDKKKIELFFDEKNSILLNDNEVENLYNIILEGL